MVNENYKIMDYKKYVVTESINTEKVDNDRCNYTWEQLYIPFYSNIGFWTNSDFSKRKNGVIVHEETSCEISGDALFNFKKGLSKKDHQKYEYFRDLLIKTFDGNEKQDYYLEQLDYCNEMFYSLHNFILTPKTGGMNNFKGSSKYMKDVSQSLDRGDKFIYYVNVFFGDNTRSVDNAIFSSANGRKSKFATPAENTAKLKKTLKMFLDYIGSFNNYCHYMFLIDNNNDDLIERIIKNGKKDIDSGYAVVEYMNLACEFWKTRHKILYDR